MTAFTIWGNIGNQAYAVPMVKLTPYDPTTQGYLLGWNTTEGGLDYVPISWDVSSNDITLVGNLTLAATKVLNVGANQVVGARRTGWVAATGTATRSTFDTATVTLPQLAERMKALLDDLTAHGLIGA